MSIIFKKLKPIGSFVKCPRVSLKTVLLPLCFLGILGFLLNSQITFLPGENFRTCQPRVNIAFLKTHKCAGSSVQNIIMRFGDRHNLTFALPSRGNYIGHPVPFNSDLLPASPSLPVYNILAHHTRLDHGQIMSVMPNDTILVTIVRDPARVFESSFVYYGLDKSFAGNLHKLIRLVPPLTTGFLSRRYRNGRIGINQMMFDLGADPAIFSNESLVRHYVGQLDSWFHLVLVAERMDESLILLKHLMCWDTDDVVAFKLNARNPKYKSNLSENEISVLRTLNRADQMLYDHFAAKLDGLVKAFGLDRMESEVSLLQERTRNWYELCVKGEKPLKAFRRKSKYYHNPRVMMFETRLNVSNGNCSSLTMAELPYTDYLRHKQTLFHPIQSSPA